MKSLQYLSIDCSEQVWLKLLVRVVPEYFPVNLTSCTLKLNNEGRWDVRDAIPLLNHPGLRRLTLHSVYSMWRKNDVHGFPKASFSGPKSTFTSLETLNLIDCNISPADLHQILCYPLALQSLAMCSDHDSERLHNERDAIYYQRYFQDISTSPPAKSLTSFRFDVRHIAGCMGPTPGMCEMENFRYLDTLQCDLNHVPSKGYLDASNISSDDCSIYRLLPPKLEVLKIHNESSKTYDNFEDILQNKAVVVPLLRKIVLVLQWRDEAMAKELREAAADTDRNHRDDWNQDLQTAVASEGTKDPHDKLRALCNRNGVELMLLWEDSWWKEVMREGAGTAVWEIPEQIA